MHSFVVIARDVIVAFIHVPFIPNFFLKIDLCMV